MRTGRTIVIALSLLLLSTVFSGAFILYHRTPISHSLFYLQEIFKFWSWGFILDNAAGFFLLIILLLTSAGAGYKLLKLFRINTPDQPLAEGLLPVEFLFSTGLGLGFFSLMTLGSGFFGLLSAFVFYPLLLCSALCSYQEIRYFLSLLPGTIRKMRLTPAFIIYGCCMAIILLLSIILAIGGPPILFDSLVYHLAIPDIYIKNHKIVNIPHLVFANYPLNTEMLFGLAMILWNDTLAQLIHPLFGILTGLGIYCLSRDYFGNRAGFYASMAFFSMPTVIFTMTFAFNDLALTYYIVLAVYAMLNWMKEHNTRWIALSGIFTGLAMGTKYSGVISFVILAGFIVRGDLPQRRRDAEKSQRNHVLKDLSIFSAAALLPVLPWLVKNIIFAGNPVYPFLYNIFGGANWGEFDVQRFTQEMSHYCPSHFGGIWRYLSLPLFITCDWSCGDIPLGPIILVCIPILFFVKANKTVKYLLAFSAVYFLFWVNTSMVIRFLLPCAALLCPIIGYVLDSRGEVISPLPLPCKNIKQNESGQRILQSIFELPLFIALILNIYTLYTAIGEHPAFYLKNAGREEKLLSAAPVKDYYRAIKFINERLPQNSKILFIGEPRSYYCQQEVLTSSELNTEVICSLVKGSKNIDQLFQRLRRLRITHVLYNRHGAVWLQKQFHCLHWENDDQRLLYESFLNSLIPVYAVDDVYLFQVR